MTKSYKNTAAKIIFTFFSVAAVAFIFYNSSLSAVDSGTHSSSITVLINNILHSLSVDITISDFFVRKCAHFVEYFVLGTLLFYTVLSYSKSIAKSYITLIIGLIVASVDEFIQLFSVGRSPQLSDVLLDFCGVFVATVIFYSITKIAVSKREVRVNE